MRYIYWLIHSGLFIYYGSVCILAHVHVQWLYYMCVLLYLIICMLWSASSYFKSEIMLYCFNARLQIKFYCSNSCFYSYSDFGINVQTVSIYCMYTWFYPLVPLSSGWILYICSVSMAVFVFRIHMIMYVVSIYKQIAILVYQDIIRGVLSLLK